MLDLTLAGLSKSRERMQLQPPKKLCILHEIGKTICERDRTSTSCATCHGSYQKDTAMRSQMSAHGAYRTGRFKSRHEGAMRFLQHLCLKTKVQRNLP